MSRLKTLNRMAFDLAPVRAIGRRIYATRQQRQSKNQSTTTKFYRNLAQLAAFNGPLADLTDAPTMRILVAGCSVGCEAFTIAGYLAWAFPKLNLHIDAYDIDVDAIAIARAATYGAQHGVGAPATALERKLEGLLFETSGDKLRVREAIRQTVRFGHGDVRAGAFPEQRDYDCVFGQNFMIHMQPADTRGAFRALVDALGPGGALFVGGMDLEMKSTLVADHTLDAVDWNVVAIHDADDMRRSAWPWHYWALEPIDPCAHSFVSRYATIFRKRPTA